MGIPARVDNAPPVTKAAAVAPTGSAAALVGPPCSAR